MEDSLPGSHNIDVPNIKRTELTLITIDDEGFLSLMNDVGECRNDIKLPDDTEDDIEISKRIKSYVEEGKECIVTILAAMGIEKVVECKEL